MGHLSCKRKRERRWNWKNIPINNVGNFPKFCKRQTTDSRSWLNPKDSKLKEILTKIIHYWTLESWRQRRNFETEKRNGMLPIRERQFEFLIRNHRSQKEIPAIFQVLETRVLIQWKYPWGMKRNQDMLTWRKVKRIYHQQTYSKRIDKASYLIERKW